MKALLLVDLQNDFCPAGALPVPDGQEVIAIANQLMPQFGLVVATQDWHPPDHKSFAANHPWRKPGQVIELRGLPQILWPIHCVQNSFGAEFVNELNSEGIHRIFHKGTEPDIDSYSGFFDNGHLKATGLNEYLQSRRVDVLYIMGLATDYCVKFTVLDALQLGFETFLIEDGCRGIDLQPGDVDRAVQQMVAKGARLVRSELLKN